MNEFSKYVSDALHIKMTAIAKNPRPTPEDLGKITACQRILEMCSFSPMTLNPYDFNLKLRWGVQLIMTHEPSEFELGIAKTYDEFAREFPSDFYNRMKGGKRKK